MEEIVFFTPERLTEFWGFVQILLKFASPGVLIAVAVIGVGMLITIVIASFKKGSSDDKDDDDFDVKYY